MQVHFRLGKTQDFLLNNRTGSFCAAILIDATVAQSVERRIRNA